MMPNAQQHGGAVKGIVAVVLAVGFFAMHATKLNTLERKQDVTRVQQ
jgi:hypothetical protein